MRFSEFCSDWLGKYYGDFTPVGKGGDFYTAVSIGELFGFFCAKKIIDKIDLGEIKLPATLCEIGSNDGTLLKDIYRYIKNHREDLLKSIDFAIIEPHEKLRKIQREKIEFEFSHYFLDEFECENAIFVANELFDAFSFDLIDGKNYAFVDKDYQINFRNFSGENPFANTCAEFSKGEISDEIFEFLKSICKNCKKFYFLTFDYFDLGIRNDFSVRIFKKHQIFDPFKVDLKEYFGASDITRTLSLAEFECYFSLLGIRHKITRQNKAFLECNLPEMTQVKYANQIKNLLFGLSDNFYCLEFHNQ